MSFHPDIELMLDDIRADKSDGATSLAIRGLDALEALCGNLPDEVDDALALMVGLAGTIDSLRPSMAAIGVQAILAVNRAMSMIGEGMRPSSALRKAVIAEREILGQANTTIAALALKELGTGGTIVTCSWSVTAMRTVLALSPARVFVGEGHRMGDGLRASRWLAARGLDIVVLPDGALPTVVSRANNVIVGADQVLADGSVVNRCSTYSLALAARYSGVPMLVACQRIKLSGNTSVEIEETEQLYSMLPEGVTARAPVFDLTPRDLIDSILTESGRLSPEEAGAVGEGIAVLRRRVLGGQQGA